jgi:adenylate cyclase
VTSETNGDGVADRIWDGCRSRILSVGGAASAALVLVAVVVPTAVFVDLYFRISLVRTLAWATATWVAIDVGIIFGVVRARTMAVPFMRWADGASSDGVAARSAALELPLAIVRGAAPWHLALGLGVSLPYLAALAHLGVPAIFGVAVAACIVLTGAAVLTHATLAALLRPALVELAPVGPAGGLPRLRSTVGARMFVALTVAAAGVGICTPAVASHMHTRQSLWVVSVVMATLLAAYLAILFRLMIGTWLIRPLRELASSARRIGQGDLQQFAPVTSADELGDLAIAFNEMQQGLRERATLHAAFGSYVDPVLATRLLESGSDVFEGQEVDVTVLFLDVRGFTAYSESIAPSTAVTLLNALFDVAVPVLHEHGGHANHYLGDGLLAVFGAPLPIEHHANAAVAAAIAIQQQVRAEFGSELRLGIGINTGPVIAGTVGGGGRHEFTVIGDTVNVAARVEQLTKDTGDAILITEATRAALSPPRRRTTTRGEFAVRGKENRLVLHAVNPFPRTTR